MSWRVQQRLAEMLWALIVQWSGVAERAQQIWALMRAQQQDRAKGPKENSCKDCIVDKSDN
jgi:hypothetical protein